MKFVRIYLKLIFSFLLLVVNNVFADPLINLWDIAKTAPLTLSASDIFSFVTPSSTGVCIGLNFVVYQGGACATNRGTTTVKACLDNSHKEKSYYISPSELYSLVNVAYSTAPTNIRCVRMQDYVSTGNNVTSGAITCTGAGTNTCTWSTSGSTANITMNTGSVCSTVSDC